MGRSLIQFNDPLPMMRSDSARGTFRTEADGSNRHHGLQQLAMMPAFAVIEVPFHMGLEEVGVGRGPARFLRAATGPGGYPALSDGSAPAQVVHLRLRDATAAGMDAIVDLNRGLRAAVRDVIAAGACPVVLAGNCNSALGTLAGMDADRLGIVWLDAHADFNTPETSRSGALDGMVLAAAVGHCHAELRERIGMERTLREENVLLAGWRDLDADERPRLEASRIIAREAGNLADVPALLARLSRRVDAVYLHIDIDFLDPVESPGVNFRGPGGVPLAQAEPLVTEIARALPVAAVALTNHNPEYDPEGLTPAAGLRLLRALAAAFPSRAPR
jgi:arginase